jgi:hypothetical protein
LKIIIYHYFSFGFNIHIIVAPVIALYNNVPIIKNNNRPISEPIYIAVSKKPDPHAHVLATTQ